MEPAKESREDYSRHDSSTEDHHTEPATNRKTEYSEPMDWECSHPAPRTPKNSRPTLKFCRETHRDHDDSRNQPNEYQSEYSRRMAEIKAAHKERKRAVSTAPAASYPSRIKKRKREDRQNYSFEAFQLAVRLEVMSVRLK